MVVTGAFDSFREHYGPNKRRRQHHAPHLLHDEDQIDITKSAAPVRLGNDQPEPSKLGHFLPQLRIEAPLILHHSADRVRWALLFQERAGTPAQHFLLFIKAEIHLRAPSFQDNWGTRPFTPGSGANQRNTFA